MVPAELAPKSVAEMQGPPVDLTIPVAQTPSAQASKAEAAKRAPPRPRAATADVSLAPEPSPPSPNVAVAPAAVPPAAYEAAPVDAMQQLRDALSRCAGGLMDRIVCDQRVRREYCDGRWGQVPQCQSSVVNDRGQ